MIVKMKKLRLFAFKDDKNRIINDFMRMGCIQINHTYDDINDDAKIHLQQSNIDDSMLNDQRNEMKNALSVLNRYIRVKKGLFPERETFTESEISDPEKQNAALESAKMVNDLKDKIDQTYSEELKLISEKTALLPWKPLDHPLGKMDTTKTEIILATVSVNVKEETVLSQIKSLTEEFTYHMISRDNLLQYVAVISFKNSTEDILSVLKPLGFTQIHFSNYDRTALQLIDEIDEKISRLKKDRAESENILSQLHDVKRQLELYYDVVGIEIAKEQFKGLCSETDAVFLLTGWIPEKKVAALTKKLHSYNCAFEILDPDDCEEPPVLIENSSLVSPFGIVTEMYSLPAYRAVDPNPVMSFFYFNIFGIMLSDVGYGLVLSVVCGFILFKYKLKGTVQKFVKLFFFLGLSTMFWGAAFGSWFGDIVKIVSKLFTGSEVNIPPLWFNPADNPMQMLIFSLLVGVLHIFAGMCLAAYKQIRDGHPMNALLDVGIWFLFLSSVAMLLFGVPYAMEATLLFGILYAFASGRSAKNPFAKFFVGLKNIYFNLSGYFSDILSYSRLMALSLATGIIASVINTMGSLFGNSIVGAIGLLLVFIVGHIFNLGINVLGSYVHASRLQYVEFFGKFFEAGGSAFQPAEYKTKFIEINNTEE